MAKQWHNKHISTKWGIAILGFLVIVTALLIPYLSQQQSTQSEAAGDGKYSYKQKTKQKQSPLTCSGVSKCVESAKSCTGIIVPNSITDKRDEYYKKPTCLYEGNKGVIKKGVCCNPYK